MDSQEFPAGLAAVPSPAHRKQHKPSSSLGSLYEVLADLDETQLQYLIQEMNHTGHQHVPVSQAVSAFEAPNPSASLTTLRRASMLPPAHPPAELPVQSAQLPAQPYAQPPTQPPAQGVQRQLSKSQQGKLRLQTAFQRAPSLRQRPRQESHETDRSVRGVAPQAPEPQPTNGQAHKPEVSNRSSTNLAHSGEAYSGETHSNPAPGTIPGATHGGSRHAATRPGNVGCGPHEPANRPERQQDPVKIGNLEPPAVTTRKRSGTHYKRIPRPDFNLPVGVSVTDLLQLLEVEYLFSNSQQLSSSSGSSSPSSAFSTHLSPSRPLPKTHNWPGHRPVRRHSSRLDMALEAERNASGAEEIGLGMLEPRPIRSASLGTSAASTPIMPMDFFDQGFQSETPPPVMEGIFDVLENK